MPSNERWLPALDDRPGPAAPIAEARANAMVDAAIGAALAPVPSPVPRPRLVRFAKPLAYGMAAALVTAAAIAGAVAWSHRVSRTVVAPAAPSPAPTESALSSTPLPGPSALPLPQTSEAPPAPAVSSPVHARAPSSEVADLLARANDLRAARRWKDASLAYEHVASAHPGSPEAYAAEVAAADLRLEQLRDPAGALRLYRAAQQRRARAARSASRSSGASPDACRRWVTPVARRRRFAGISRAIRMASSLRTRARDRRSSRARNLSFVRNVVRSAHPARGWRECTFRLARGRHTSCSMPARMRIS